MRSEGRRVRRGPLAATYVPLVDGDDSARVAFSIPKRVGGAVQRNRLRRRLRAILVELDGEGVVPPGALLLSVGADVAARAPDELRNDVKRLLSAIDEGRAPGEPR